MLGRNDASSSEEISTEQSGGGTDNHMANFNSVSSDYAAPSTKIMTRDDTVKRQSLSGTLGCPLPLTETASDIDAYGLNGILRIVRLSNTPLSLLSLGTDLTTLGLNLNAPDTLFASFFSPNLDQQPPKDDVEFYLPPCCYMNPPNLKMTHLQKFTAETLFYMFYTIVGDILQGYAAAELFNRGWVYHIELQKWFTTIAAQRATGANDIREATPRENTWIYFEPSLWQKRFYTGDLDATRFLKSESLRDLLDETLQKNQATDVNVATDTPVSLAEAQSSVAMRPPTGPSLGLQPGTGASMSSLLSSQVAAALQAQQQNAYGSLGAPPGITQLGAQLGGTQLSQLGSQLGPIGGTLHHQGQRSATSVGGLQVGGNSVSMASLQNAIEALLARGLQQQP